MPEVRALNLCRRLADLHKESVRDYRRFGLEETQDARIAVSLMNLYLGIVRAVDGGVRSLADEVADRLRRARETSSLFSSSGANTAMMKVCADARIEALEELQAVLSEEGGGDAGND